MSKKMSENEKAGMIAIVGGVLMLLAGVTGAAAWVALGNLIVDVTGSEGMRLPFQILALIGSLGGFVVILGGLIIHGKLLKAKKEKAVPTGKFLITIGAGFGLIGLIIFLLLTLLGDNPGANIMAALGLGFVGLVLSIVARQKAVK